MSDSGYPGYQSYRGRGRGRRPFRGEYRPPRSLSQMGRDDREEAATQQAQIDKLKEKEVVYDEKKVEKFQPKKERPQLDAPKIRLDTDFTDWIEKQRANVEIRLRPEFENEIIAQHAKQIGWSTTVLQYSSEQQRDEIRLMYEAYSICNVAYRLLLTLPKSQKRRVADLLIQLNMGEQPRNTPLIAEMCTHIGKHRNDAYGNLRLEGPMLEARRRILRATLRASAVRGMEAEFRWRPGKRPTDVDTTKEWIWNDADSLSWLRHRAMDEFERLRKINYGLNETKAWIAARPDQYGMAFSVPYIDLHLVDPDTGGPWHLLENDVINYYSMLKACPEEVTQQLMAVVMIFMISGDFFATSLKRIKDVYPRLDGKIGGFQNATMTDLLTYLGFQGIHNLVTDQDLLYNYGCVVDGYETIAEPTIRQIFKTVPISNHEFGDEAQMMKVTDTSLGVNPRVESAFKIRDPHLIGAAGVYGFPLSVRYNVADYTIMKRAKKPIISELIEKFCRK